MFKTDRFENALAIAGLVMLALVAVASVAEAGIVLTDGPNRYELRTRAGSKVGDESYATVEACRAAITVPGEYRCAPTGVITAVGVCDPVPPPPPVVDAEGFTVLGDLSSEACANEGRIFFQTQPVRDPWPSCALVERPVQITGCVTLTDTWWTAP